MHKVVTVIGILILVLLLGILIHSPVSQVPLLAAADNVISGTVGIVSDLHCQAPYPSSEGIEAACSHQAKPRF